jgi:hypothetical protein
MEQQADMKERYRSGASSNLEMAEEQLEQLSVFSNEAAL